MNVREAFQAFTNSQTPKVVAAQYAVESVSDSAILRVDQDAFTLTTLDMTTLEQKETTIKFSDVKSVQHFVEVPENVPDVTDRNRLLIKASRKKIQIACSEYDYNRILRVYTPPQGDE